jgi:hypothetical protein
VSALLSFPQKSSILNIYLMDKAGFKGLFSLGKKKIPVRNKA